MQQQYKKKCNTICEHTKSSPLSNEEEFRKKIHDVIKRGNISDKFTDILLSPSSIEKYRAAFTHSSVSDNNYEVYEQKGDVLANAFLIWYAYKRFPNLNSSKGVEIVALIRIKYASKNTFSDISEKLGFWPFISACDHSKATFQKDLLEDVLESFIGVTAEILDDKFMVGVGYNVVYDILKSIFDEIPIPLDYESLKDSITIIKETASHKDIKVEYKKYDDVSGIITTLYAIIYNKRIKIGTGIGPDDAVSKHNAAKEGLRWLEANGFYTKREF